MRTSVQISAGDIHVTGYIDALSHIEKLEVHTRDLDSNLLRTQNMYHKKTFVYFKEMLASTNLTVLHTREKGIVKNAPPAKSN